MDKRPNRLMYRDLDIRGNTYSETLEQKQRKIVFCFMIKGLIPQLNLSGLQHHLTLQGYFHLKAQIIYVPYHHITRILTLWHEWCSYRRCISEPGPGWSRRYWPTQTSRQSLWSKKCVFSEGLCQSWRDRERGHFIFQWKLEVIRFFSCLPETVHQFMDPVMDTTQRNICLQRT